MPRQSFPVLNHKTPTCPSQAPHLPQQLPPGLGTLDPTSRAASSWPGGAPLGPPVLLPGGSGHGSRPGLFMFPLLLSVICHLCFTSRRLLQNTAVSFPCSAAGSSCQQVCSEQGQLMAWRRVSSHLSPSDAHL